MASTAVRPLRAGVPPLLVLALATASLYLAREVLIPLALAVLFTFLLSPAVRRIETIGLRRGLATVVSIAVFLAGIGVVGWVAGNQVVSLAGKLPEYRENIAKKLKTLHAPAQGDLGKAAKALKELETEASGQSKEAAAQKPPPPKPAAVPTTPLEMIGKLGVPLLTLIAMAIAIIVLTALMLVQRDDLRDRIIRLVGAGHVHLTTKAMEDAGGRVSRYLLMQVVVNACFGIPLAVALYFIGIPNALLFGLLGFLLRFIPYLGAPAAALLPITLAFAISDGWELVTWTVGVIAVLDFTIAYVIEPWLYGESTGLSPAAIVFSALFWTWLWGPIGLLLATPMTVCISVVGRYIPQWNFMTVILSDEPVLPAPVRFYQRLVALEYEEALDLAEEHVKEHGLLSLFDSVVMSALLLAKRDRMRFSLDERRERFVFDGLLRIVEELNEKGEAKADKKKPDGEQAVDKKSGDTKTGEPEITDKATLASLPAIRIAPAQDDADYIAAVMLARSIAPEHYEALLLPRELLAAELLDQIAAHPDNALVISAVPPSAASNAAYLCKRIRQRFPQQKIVVAIWHANTNIDRVKQRLIDAGADEVVTRLPDALERIRLVSPQRAG
jgi:predicted PurR-regulated permease PerM